MKILLLLVAVCLFGCQNKSETTLSKADSLKQDSELQARYREVTDSNRIYKDTGFVAMILQNRIVKSASIKDKILTITVSSVSTPAPMAAMYCRMARENLEDVTKVVIENEKGTTLAESNCK